MNTWKKTFLMLPFTVASITITAFGISSTVYAGTADLQVAAGDSSGTGPYGGTSDTERRPGQAGPERKTSGEAVDDSLVTAKVKSALISDDQVKAFDINVKTRKGEVILTGMVDNQEQINRAVQITGDIDGVKSVSNRLTVKK